MVNHLQKTRGWSLICNLLVKWIHFFGFILVALILDVVRLKFGYWHRHATNLVNITHVVVFVATLGCRVIKLFQGLIIWGVGGLVLGLALVVLGQVFNERHMGLCEHLWLHNIKRVLKLIFPTEVGPLVGLHLKDSSISPVILTAR